MTHKPISGNKARLAVLMNQCATPGLGSLMAGRIIAGSGQLLLSLAAAALILLWFANVLKVAYTIMQSTGEPDLKHWMGLSGFGILFMAWCWAWVSSISILRDIRHGQVKRWETMQSPGPGSTSPPRMTGN